MRPKLATLMLHIKAANARLDQSLKVIEDEVRQVGEPEALPARAGAPARAGGLLHN